MQDSLGSRTPGPTRTPEAKSPKAPARAGGRSDDPLDQLGCCQLSLRANSARQPLPFSAEPLLRPRKDTLTLCPEQASCNSGDPVRRANDRPMWLSRSRRRSTDTSFLQVATARETREIVHRRNLQTCSRTRLTWEDRSPASQHLLDATLRLQRNRRLTLPLPSDARESSGYLISEARKAATFCRRLPVAVFVFSGRPTSDQILSK